MCGSEEKIGDIVSYINFGSFANQADPDYTFKFESVIAALNSNAQNKLKRLELLTRVRPLFTNAKATELADFLRKRANPDSLAAFKFKTVSYAEKSRKTAEVKIVKWLFFIRIRLR